MCFLIALPPWGVLPYLYGVVLVPFVVEGYTEPDCVSDLRVEVAGEEGCPVEEVCVPVFVCDEPEFPLCSDPRDGTFVSRPRVLTVEGRVV